MQAQRNEVARLVNYAAKLVGVAVLLAGCTPVLGRAFTNSSADFNRAAMHRIKTPGELETVADAVVSIMESSGATLVRRKTSSSGSTLVLSFRVSVERVVGTRSTSTGAYAAPSRWFRIGTINSSTVTTANYVAYGAIFYVQLNSDDRSVELQAIGLPVVDGLTACPALVIPYRLCTPGRARGSAAFADDVRWRTGITVSGAKEAEVLSGLLAQLQRKRWQDTFRASVPKSDPKNPEGIGEAFTEPAPGGTE